MRGRFRLSGLRGKVVVLTGAANGIGRETALRLARLGAQLALIDVDRKGLLKLRSEANPYAKIKIYRCDVSDPDEVKCVAKAIAKDFPGGRVDILINNAGIVGEGTCLLDATSRGLEYTLAVNSLGPLYVTKVFLPGMLKEDKGRVINVASSAGRSYSCQLSIYCASKAALIHAHNSLRLELRKRGSNVATSLLMPWQVDTKMFAGVKHWWPIRLAFPLLSTETVASKIVQLAANDSSAHDVVVLPWRLGWFLVLLDCLPLWLADYFTELAGGRHGMDTWARIINDKKN